MSYYGTDTDGNNLPVWEFDLLDYLNQNVDWYSYCLPDSASEADPATPGGAMCVEGVEGSCNPGPADAEAEWDANSKLNALLNNTWDYILNKNNILYLAINF